MRNIQSCDISKYNIIVMSVSFLLIFTAFGTVQNFETGGNKTEGDISLTILYTCFTFSNLIAPKLIGFCSNKIAMIIGSSTYALYVAANINIKVYLLYPSAAIMGVGAALLWVGQGSFVAQCANHYEKRFNYKINSKLGYFNGIFFMFYAVGNQVIGNLLAAVLFEFKIKKVVIFIVFTIINIIGVMCFVFIHKFPRIEPLLKHDVITQSNENISILSAIRLWLNPNLQKVMLMIIYIGVSESFEFGEITDLMINKMGIYQSYYAMATFGIFDAVFAIIFGKMGDKFGKLWIFVICILCHLLCYIILYLQAINCCNMPYNLYFFIPIATLLGIGDAGLKTQIYALMPVLLSEKAEVFANLKFFLSGSQTLTFAYIPSGVPWNFRLCTYIGILIVASIVFVSSGTVRKACSVQTNNTIVVENNEYINLDIASMTYGEPHNIKQSSKSIYTDHGL